MRYVYQKSHKLSGVDLKRLRSAHQVRYQLRSSLESEVGAKGLENDLVQLLRGEAKPASSLVDWCLCYGGPTLIRKLIDTARTTGADFEYSSVLRAARIDNLLPKDHVCPEYQRVMFVDEPQTTLVCLTGNAQRLNLPIQIFNLVAADFFDQIIYLRDPSRFYFNSGISSEIDSLSELIKWLSSSAGLCGEVSVLGTSSGGFNALRVAQGLNANKAVLFSPPRFLNGADALEGVSIEPEKVVMFFALNGTFDQDLYEQWRPSAIASQHCFLDTNDHATFKFLLAQGLHDGVFKWLSGAQPHYGETVYI